MAATKLSDFSGFLTPEMAQPYFAQVRKTSSVQQLARQVPLGISGAQVPVQTSKPTASWVGEGAKKPTSSVGLGLKALQPKKLATIVPVSAEVVRADPGNFMSIVRDSIAEAFAVAFDTAVYHGTNSPFGVGNNIDATTKSVELGTTTKANGGIYGDVVAGLKLLTTDQKRLTGFAFDRNVEATFLGSVDANGRPLFVDTPLEDTAPISAPTPGRLIGRQAFIGDQIATPIVTGTPNTGGIVGYGGDWSQVVWGVTSGISYRVSTEAAVTIDGVLTSLFENNLVAVLAEAEYGVLVNDPQAFVKYTDNTA
ncbi:phage major capsid protein [Rhodococcoides fascians]|uniref:phage major capsid protein n=1 Tax=Rhodococcoides fascians TaxID=1828 RepID=UPI000B9BDF4E|nr:phage major capsid protein [Rhodococcus fascians]OZE92459.1 phage major capsid protein [Rhodococcus fascians]OZF23092.1 phage major capsid protein [Rhodococcus fascians]OZF24806.1 phage major capsid protein [Rhodococcus fascians]OZF72401.1 phage major capsid protein [Rhodococcus fascians]OZF73699.1 phage major capsid protein [Rhodococcus fascians]